MSRVIKAPNVNQQKPYNVVEREKVIRHAEEEAALILQNAQMQEEEILTGASQQADTIIENANQDADAIRAQAEEEVAQAREGGQELGYNEGLQQGLEEARQQASDLIQTLQDMLAEGQSTLESMFVGQEMEIRKLVSDIVGRVIQEKVDTDDELVVRVCSECIRMAAERKTLRALVHPDDKAKIEEWVPEFMRRFDDIEKILVEEDPRVGRGGVIIESGTGGIDGRIDKQQEIFDETLLNP